MFFFRKKTMTGSATKVSPKTKGMKKKRVLIVGAGAAGTAAAYSLGKHPDRFETEIWEKAAGKCYSYGQGGLNKPMHN